MGVEHTDRQIAETVRRRAERRRGATVPPTPDAVRHTDRAAARVVR